MKAFFPSTFTPGVGQFYKDKGRIQSQRTDKELEDGYRVRGRIQS